MKKSIFSWMTIVLMAFVCAGFTACGSDDDDNDGCSGGGSKSAKVNGQSYNLAYGFWDTRGNYTCFEFSNVDLRNPSSWPEKIDMLYFNVDGITSPQPGTYNGVGIEIYSFNSKKEGVYYPGASGIVNLTIAKSGNNYTFTIPETTINYYSNGNVDESTRVPFSFSWTGSLTYYDFDE